MTRPDEYRAADSDNSTMMLILLPILDLIIRCLVVVAAPVVAAASVVVPQMLLLIVGILLQLITIFLSLSVSVSVSLPHHLLGISERRGRPSRSVHTRTAQVQVAVERRNVSVTVRR